MADAKRKGPLDGLLVVSIEQAVAAPYCSSRLADAGARVIKDTTKQSLPPGFQTAEFLLKHGLIDQIVPRLEMRERLRDLLAALHTKKRPATVAGKN